MTLKSDILPLRIFRCVLYVIKKNSKLDNLYVFMNLNNIPANILHSASGMDKNMDKAMGAPGVKRGLQ